MPKEELDSLLCEYDFQMEYYTADRYCFHIDLVHKERTELIEQLRDCFLQEPTSDEIKKALSGINAQWFEQLKREAYISGQQNTQAAYRHAWQDL